jgi:ABC-type glycerol-3-phosphate transport system substrate-binding protein
LTALIDDFQEINPGVTFSITYLDEETLFARLEDLQPGEGSPTIIFGPSRWGPQLYNRGVIEDLASTFPPNLADGIDPLALSQIENMGTILGVPLQMNGSVIFRNRALAANAATTLSELVLASRDLDQVLPHGAILDLGFERSSAFSYTCGGPLFQEDGSHELADELGTCWLELLQEVSEAGQVIFNSEDDRQRFQASEVAWIIEDSTSRFPILQALGPDAVVVDRWPVYRETGTRLVGYVWTENAYLSSLSSELDYQASWALLVFLLSPEAQLAFSQSGQGGMVPVIGALEPSDPLIAQIKEALKDGIPYPLGLELNPLVEPFERAAKAVAIQGAELETARLRALEEIQELENSLKQD